tara:strand:+ start:253 stop:1482 length:1230 start_codon:yes stop_codon:yes gene_type:complete
MPLPDIKVEVGFDLTNTPGAPFFTLDNDEKGRLDNIEYGLGGAAFFDVTDRAVAVSIERGKEPIVFGYPAAEISVELNNHDRTFDPEYPDSPFARSIVPGIEVRVSANDRRLFVGIIEDWDLTYRPNGDSRAFIKGLDAIALLNRQSISPHTPTEQSTGERINAILDRPEIGWPADLRDIDDGTVTIAANPIEEFRPALTYLQNIASSDPGDFYIDREGKATFRDRRKAPTSGDLITFGEGGVPFDSLAVSYGQEQLFNEINVVRQGGGTVVASDLNSINSYGVRSLDINNIQVASDVEAADIAVGLASLYSEPEYRFRELEVYLHKDALTPSEVNSLLEFDLGSIGEVVFTPNGVGSPIQRYVEVIGVDHQIEVDSHVVVFGFKETRYAPLVLDDAEFGKLDVGTLSW